LIVLDVVRNIDASSVDGIIHGVHRADTKIKCRIGESWVLQLHSDFRIVRPSRIFK
jgi:hypothetical protein